VRAILLTLIFCLQSHDCQAQRVGPSQSSPPQTPGSQINVNWLYGSYIPKDVPWQPLTGGQRLMLYVRQTYTTPGIYVKTTIFAVHDQITDSYPAWGKGFGGLVKRLGSRQAQFVVQNSVTSFGDAILGWEPRYDRCQCDGFWPRTRHAVWRNFVTYGGAEKSMRPQLMPYAGAFGASALATTWEPGKPAPIIKGYQAAVTQVFVGAGINWIVEFSPEINRIIKRKKHHSDPKTQSPK
jgi:hypothetical protein